MTPATGHKKPLLILIAAPSGAGKSTLCDILLERNKDIQYSISCTTRAPRGAEVDGRDYHFLTADEFEARSERGDFIEEAAVHGNRYGTLRKAIESCMHGGADILLDIDVQGARQVREHVASLGNTHILKNALVDIFTAPPSMKELRRRLETRAEDSPEVIEQRMENAKTEMACSNEFSHVVINDDLDKAYAQITRIISSQRNE